MIFLFYIGILVFGSILGIVVGMTSIGKGLIGTPGLLLLGVDKFAAVGTIGLAGVFMMMSSAYKHYRNENINAKTVVAFSVSSIPVSFLCANYKEELNEFINLRHLIGGAIIISICTLVYKFFIAKKEDVEFKNSDKNFIFSVLLGIILGFFIGATSISGSLIVIAFMLCLKMPEKLAIGTTNCVAIFSLAAASCAHLLHGHIDWLVFAIFTPAVMVGGYVGANMTEKVSQKPLRIIILTLLFIAAICIFCNKNDDHQTENSINDPAKESYQTQ
jgi:uncharacterized membrane protein YfcA